MNEHKEEKNSHLSKNERQPFRMRLPGFILEEDIGLGDAIERVTYTIGIRPSSDCGCERRAAVLNRWVALSQDVQDKSTSSHQTVAIL
jgi:hypothetical protein